MNSQWTCLQAAAGETEAQQIKAFLEAHGVPCQLKGEALRKTHGLTLDGLGEVRLHVPASKIERARELMALVESGALNLDEKWQPEQS